MELGYLSGFWWGLAAIPIVVFYILKIRLRRAPVSTVMFWEQIFEDKRPRAIWQRLRHLLSLLLQLAFLALVVLALVEPFFPWEMLQARRVVLVVDHSASMNAADGTGTRLDEALAEGGRLIRALRWRDEMAIIAAGASPRVACGLTGHQRTLHDALDALEPAEGPTRLREAAALARRLLAGHENGRVILLSDGCTKEIETLTQDAALQWRPIGSDLDNVAITQFQVRRSLLDPIGYQVLVEAANYSDHPVECRLELDLDENVVDVIPLRLSAGEQWRRVFNHTTADGGQLIARINRPDALPADNRAVAILPRRERVPVTLVTEGNLYLQRVFEAIPLVDLTLAGAPPATAPSGGVLVLHRQAPEKLPEGNVLVIEPTGPTDLWQLGETIESAVVARQESESPLMTHVRLENVLMPEAKRLQLLNEGAEVLVRSLADDPLYAAIKRSEGKLLVLTVNLEKGDLPLRTAFPILMTNALSWLQGDKGELRESVPAGSTVEIDVQALRESQPSGPERNAPLVLRAPDGGEFP
ncbi:MAG: BatA and WFA domain-containing protein, partial [Planctomycetes bacterium]|nr:BatA and WFA domain-containing protein [Planctomycetota bacterium]